MTLVATPVRFRVSLAHVDRNVFAELDIKTAKHPSETTRYLLSRVLAFALLHEEGLAFSKGGLSSPDEPALSLPSPTGGLALWVEIGLPTPDRLHKAAKAADRVVVVAAQDPRAWIESLAKERVHKRERVEVMVLPGAFLDAVADVMEPRGGTFSLTCSDDALYVDVGGGVVVDGAMERLSLPAGAP